MSVSLGVIWLKNEDHADIQAKLTKRTEGCFVYFNLYDAEHNRIGNACMKFCRAGKSGDISEYSIRMIENDSIKEKRLFPEKYKIKLVGTHLMEAMIAHAILNNHSIGATKIDKEAIGFFKRMGFIALSSKNNRILSPENLPFWKNRILNSNLSHERELIDRLNRKKLQEGL